MRYYSYAGQVRGSSNPEETHLWTAEADGEECQLDGCTQRHCTHTVMMWSGGEYSKDHTWIAAEQKAVFNLEDMR